MVQVFHHTGTPVKYGRARVHGIRLYYITAGKGPALVLLHGTPKNSFYWYKLFPLLTEHSAQFRKQGVWCWHLGFFFIPHVPEMLIQGHEREFWEHFIKQECYNPGAVEEHALNHWIKCVKQPGCLRGILETYRAGFKNADINRELAKKKLKIPVMTIGAPEFVGPQVRECALKFAESVKRSEIFEECGHSLALEAQVRLATCLKQFIHLE